MSTVDLMISTVEKARKYVEEKRSTDTKLEILYNILIRYENILKAYRDAMEGYYDANAVNDLKKTTAELLYEVSKILKEESG